MTSCNHAFSTEIVLPTYEVSLNGCSAMHDTNDTTNINDASCFESQEVGQPTPEFVSGIGKTCDDVDFVQSRCKPATDLSYEEYIPLDGNSAEEIEEEESENGVTVNLCSESICNGLSVYNDSPVQNKMTDEAELSTGNQISNDIAVEGEIKPSSSCVDNLSLTSDESSVGSCVDEVHEPELVVQPSELLTVDGDASEVCESLQSNTADSAASRSDSQLSAAEPDKLLPTIKTSDAGMPLLNIPNSGALTSEKSCDFSLLPVSGPISDTRHPILPHTGQNKQEVFTVQPTDCSVEFSDVFLGKSVSGLHSDGSVDRDGKESLVSPVHSPKPVTAPVDDSIVDSILCDDDDDDLKNDVGGPTTVQCSPLRQKSVSFSTDAAGASLKIVPGSSVDTTSLNSLDTHLDNVDLESSGGFVEISLQSSGGSERFDQITDSSHNSGLTSKPSGFAGFLSRLSRKSDAGLADSAPGWKLFGKVPPKEAPDKNPDDISEEFKAKVSQSATKISPLHQKLTQQMNAVQSGNTVEDMDRIEIQPCSEEKLAQHQEKEVIKSASRDVIRRSDREVPSTTALILEQRPGGLPSKSPEEALRHQQMYNEMVEAARKKEKKELKLRKKQRELQMKYEEQMSNALRVWNTQILPCWETAKGSKKAQELWWNGLPPSIRGKVWKLAIGNDLNVTAELYEICLVRAKEKLKILRDADSDSLSSMNESPGNRESSVELIKLDVSRTFPQLCIFQHGGPYHQVLQGLLGAYACYRPDVGYVQGMSFLAAVLLLNMDAVDTFICFANLLNKPCEVAFFRLDESLMKAYFETYELFFQENLPQLFAHFKGLQLNPDIYIIDWMFTLFTKSLPLDVASRVWDVFCRDGEEFLFRTALGILRMYRDILMRLDFIHLAQFLTRLPDNISGTELFENIAQIRMVIEKQKFTQVLATQAVTNADRRS